MTRPFQCGPLIVLLLVSAPAAAQTRDAATDQPLVVTTGEGIVQSAPDRAFISVSAESRASNPREAQRRNTELMAPVHEKLRGAGIPAEATRTTAYDLQREWDWVNNKRVPRGYVARNTIEVRVDAIDRLGELLDLVVSAGATSVGDIRFDLKDRAKLEREALRLAVADARARAEAAAAGTGQTIAGVLRIEEQGAIAPPPMPMVGRTMMAAEQSAADVPIAAGQLELRARVTLTCALK